MLRICQRPADDFVRRKELWGPMASRLDGRNVHFAGSAERRVGELHMKAYDGWQQARRDGTTAGAQDPTSVEGDLLIDAKDSHRSRL